MNFYSLHPGLHAFHVQYKQTDTIRQNAHMNLITIMLTATHVPQQHVGEGRIVQYRYHWCKWKRGQSIRLLVLSCTLSIN